MEIFSLLCSLPDTTARWGLSGKGWWEEGKTGRSHTDKLRLGLGLTQLQFTPKLYSGLWGGELFSCLLSLEGYGDPWARCPHSQTFRTFLTPVPLLADEAQTPSVNKYLRLDL